jgi:hypothetical protein
MPKNILIFSDGTGHAGGLTPDQNVSNIYKLYRATRCGPENAIDLMNHENEASFILRSKVWLVLVW